MEQTHDIAPSESRLRLLTTAELSARLRVSESRLKHHRAAGRGPAFLRLGKLIRYDIADVEAYERASRVDPVGGRP